MYKVKRIHFVGHRRRRHERDRRGAAQPEIQRQRLGRRVEQCDRAAAGRAARKSISGTTRNTSRAPTPS
jgi:hypothetical protein